VTNDEWEEYMRTARAEERAKLRKSLAVAFVVAALLIALGVLIGGCAGLPVRGEPDAEELRRIHEERISTPENVREGLRGICPF